MLCLPQNVAQRNTRHAATPDSRLYPVVRGATAVAHGVSRVHPRGSHRCSPGCTDVPLSALRSMISWITLRGSDPGSYRVAIDQRLWPGRTTTERRLW